MSKFWRTTVKAELFPHRLMLDPKNYSAKPDDKEIKRKKTGINDRITNYLALVTVDQLALAICNGQTWIPGYIEGGRKNVNWKSQSIFALDFDNSEYVIDPATGAKVKEPETGKFLKKQVERPIIFQQALGRLREYGLDCTFAYPTFSHTDKWHRFRIVFQLSECIISNRKRAGIQLCLQKFFPEADNCPDSCRLWYGTRGCLIYTNYEYCLTLDDLIRESVLYSTRNGDKSNLSKKINRNRKRLDFNEKQVNALLNKGKTENSLDFKNSRIKSEETYHYFSFRTQYYPVIYPKVLERGVLENVNFDELANKIKILSDFMNPDDKLEHPALLGLATNLYWLEGGQALFKRCIEANPDYAYDKPNIMAWCREIQSIPKKLEDFSPYKEDWEYPNLLIAAKLPRGDILQKIKYSPISLQEAETLLDRTLSEVLYGCSK